MLISAELLNKNTIKLELDKSFYNGVSSYFKLKDNFGLSKNLEIKEVKEQVFFLFLISINQIIIIKVEVKFWIDFLIYIKPSLKDI